MIISSSKSIKLGNKRLLIFCSHYPPGPKVGGVARIGKLIKYLPDIGWDSIIVTSKLGFKDKQSNTLLHEIEDKAIVYRLPFLYPGGAIKIIYKYLISPINFLKVLVQKFRHNNKSKIEHNELEMGSRIDKYLVPDLGVFWSIAAIFSGLYCIKRYKPDIILATAPFHSSLISAYITSKISGIPFVVDLRDPWTTNPFAIKKINILSKFEFVLEKKIYESASKIICVHKNFIQPITKKYNIGIDKFNVISNGYDEDDFKNIKSIVFPKKTIIHAGSFYPGRTPDIFIEALKRISFDSPYLLSDWSVIFIGSPGYADFQKNNIEASIVCQVKNAGNLSHEETIQNMSGADILLLLPGIGSTTLTGKIFEYMALKKPIFCISPDGAASKVINDFNMGISADLESINDVTDKLTYFLAAVSNKDFSIGNSNKLTSSGFTRKEIAKSFKKTFQNIMADG